MTAVHQLVRLKDVTLLATVRVGHFPESMDCAHRLVETLLW